MADLKKIIKPEDGSSSTKFPELDAINGLIRIADEYRKNGEKEKCDELTAKIQKALDRIKNEVIK